MYFRLSGGFNRKFAFCRSSVLGFGKFYDIAAATAIEAGGKTQPCQIYEIGSDAEVTLPTKWQRCLVCCVCCVFLKKECFDCSTTQYEFGLLYKYIVINIFFKLLIIFACCLSL